MIYNIFQYIQHFYFKEVTFSDTSIAFWEKHSSEITWTLKVQSFLKWRLENGCSLYYDAPVDWEDFRVLFIEDQKNEELYFSFDSNITLFRLF